MLKGTTTFELTNVKTGEKEFITEHNMFTGALDDVINHAPYYGNNFMLGLSRESNKNAILNSLLGGAYYTDSVTSNTYFKQRGIGGLLLFPKAIEENVNTFYAPADNKPTGIASNDTYIDADLRRGSYNVVESGFVSNSQGEDIGFRMVWDFTTTQANGEIACAALTSYRGGKAYLNAESIAYHETDFYNNFGRGICITEADDPWNGGNSFCPNGFAFACDELGVYFYAYSATGVQRGIYRTNRSQNKFSILRNPRDNKLIVPFSSDRAVFMGGIIDEDIYIFSCSAQSSATGTSHVTIEKYNRKTGEMTTESISYVGSIRASGLTACVGVTKRNGHRIAYFPAYNNAGIYKVDLDNTADVTLIECTANNNIHCVGDYVMSNAWVIESDDTVHAFPTNASFVPIGLVGTWLVNTKSSNPSNYLSICETIFSPYLATINNMNAPVVKTADKTMKVTYTVTEV